MLVALSGTPGTGKSTVAHKLREMGFDVLDLKDLANGLNLFEGYDKARKSRIYDLEAVSNYISRINEKGGIVILEGLIAHLLPVDIAIVLRCRTPILEKRLVGKGYTKEKIRENLEAEALNIISQESHDETDTYEIDTTNMNVKEVADSVELIIKGSGSKYKKRIDFLKDVIDWY